MDIEDKSLEALTRVAGRPEKKQKYPKFQSVYIIDTNSDADKEEKKDGAKEEKEPLLKPQGVLSNQVLYFDPNGNKVVWFTKATQRELYFIESLGIPKGKANVPPMLWVANRNGLAVFALPNRRRPTINTKLYNAPFFNVYEDGNVCMGTVDVRIKKTASLEEFINKWEGFFFNSYFSHLMHGHNPINGNCVSLWENLIATGDAFPMEVLTENNLTLKDILR